MSKKTTTGHGRRTHSAPHGHTTLQDWRLGRTPAPRRRRMSNYAINLAFLETYARESGYAPSNWPRWRAASRDGRSETSFATRTATRTSATRSSASTTTSCWKCMWRRPSTPRSGPMAKPWQLRLFPKRGDGADRPCLTRDATMPATICLIAPPSYRAKLLRPTTK